MVPSRSLLLIIGMVLSHAALAAGYPKDSSRHWAFFPVRATRPVGEEATANNARHPIDHYIRTQLEAAALRPSPEADRATLLRRIHLDLTGLPPSPDDAASFMADSAPDAYQRRVDQLLQSPHYGERWSRWWLDAARYADSNGYSVDAPRSLWPWRDWVIRSLNNDKPFDQFLTEQLAGDLLPDATLDQRIATGFHRNTQINQEGGIDPEQFRIESVIDRVNTTATVFLGLTLACSQCHDHKFDPLPQREYFQIYSFFNDQDEPTLPVPSPRQQTALATHAAQVADLKSRLKALSDSSDTGNASNEDVSRLKKELAKLEKSPPVVDSTLVLAERAQPRDSFLFIKGDFTRRGPDVTPGTPSVLHPFTPPPDRRPNRLDLARWLVDPANPLTARVTVNRVWQHYFGRGLVETENDFGTQGTPPTHPELLDWLAADFIAKRWSLRSLHRTIVTSATYRQASRHRPDIAERDPLNRLYGRQNRLRLDAEIIRDVALSASGLLDRTIGGPSVHPPQPDGVMSLGQSNREWKASQGPDRFRRGMYTYFWRATPHPALTVFDAPDAFSTCTRRLRSNTPLQALTLLNDAAFHEIAQSLGRRVIRDFPENERVNSLFRLCVGRGPSPSEHARLEQLLREESNDHGLDVAWQTAARVLLNLDETITRE